MVVGQLHDDFSPRLTHELFREGQRLWIEESGNPKGIPVLFLHGGPGSGCKPHHRRFFNPHRFRIFLHDQRGCGRSSSEAPIGQNTTQEILADLAHIQTCLNIPRWILFGGSWGATLALLYAQLWPDRVAGIVLRGTFLGRKKDLEWFIGPSGVRRRFPDAWAAIPELASLSGLSEVIESLWLGVSSEDPALRWQAASAWEQWGAVVTLGEASRARLSTCDERVIQQSEIELHYARHQYFIRENQIIQNIARISGIPAVIIHGQKDLVCPCEAGSLLHQLMPGSTLCILSESSHVPDSGMIEVLVQATEAVADLGFET